MKAEELKLQFAEKWGWYVKAISIDMQRFELNKNTDYCLSDLNALIEKVIEEGMRNMYPKEFIEWAVENCRCEADGLWFYDWDEKAEQYKKCLTTDELFNYWKENVR